MPYVQDVQKRPRPANWLVFQGRENLAVNTVQMFHRADIPPCKLHVGTFETKKGDGDDRIVPDAARPHVEPRTCESSEDRMKEPITAHVVSLTLDQCLPWRAVGGDVLCSMTRDGKRENGQAAKHSHMKRTETLPLLTSPSQGTFQVCHVRLFWSRPNTATLHTNIVFKFSMSVCSGQDQTATLHTNSIDNLHCVALPDVSKQQATGIAMRMKFAAHVEMLKVVWVRTLNEGISVDKFRIDKTRPGGEETR